MFDYFDKIICTSNSISPCITQSWINYTETNQFQHKHSHPNSYISGVFYISADKKVDSVTFYKSYREETIKLNINKYNMFNSTSFKFPVETGNILLFRSFLIHGVEKKKGPDTRMSLSFNVFFKGKIGTAERSTELTLG